MKEYIEKQLLLRFLKRVIEEEKHDSSLVISIIAITRVIERMPTIEVSDGKED